MLLRLYTDFVWPEAVLPPLVAFVIDEDGRPKKQRDDYSRQGRGRLQFVSGMLEDHLLDKNAISHVLACESARLDIKNRLSEAELAELLAKNKLDGGRFLKQVFGRAFETELEFQKTRHSVQLAAWLARHRPEALEPVLLPFTQALAKAEQVAQEDLERGRTERHRWQQRHHNG